MNTATLVLPHNARSVEARAPACRAITCLREGMEPLVMGPITLAEIEARKANPDEAPVKVHTCLK